MMKNWVQSALLAVLLPLLVVAQVQIACPLLAARDSTTRISDLRPTDVKIMMTMGDSVLSGFAMVPTGVENTWTESRGRSFCGGGDEGVLTVPNLFRFYNPAVRGYSVGTRDSQVCYGEACPGQSYYTEDDGTNAAKPGAKLMDVVSDQIDYLIRQVNQREDMDVLRDWKVLTLMVGMDDLCNSCTFNQTYLTANDYEGNLMAALERIRTSLPRTFVNLVTSANMSLAYELAARSPQCANVTRNLFISCKCLFDHTSSAARRQIDSLTTQFNERAVSVASYYQRKAYDDFAVVVQPFMSQTNLAGMPIDFLSPVDCYHPSMSAHEMMATALWNNMLTPAQFKQSYIDPDDTIICPSDDSLLYTF